MDNKESLEAPVVEIKKRGKPAKVKAPVPEVIEFSVTVDKNPDYGNSVKFHIDCEHETESLQIDFSTYVVTVNLICGKSFSRNLCELGLEKREYFYIFARKNRFDFALLCVPSKTNRMINLCA